MERDVYDVFPNPDSEIDRESYPILLKEWQVRIAIMKKYGYDTVAFSELVHEYALAAAAIRDGHAVSEDEIAAFIKEQSDNIDMALSDPEFKSEIEKSLADSGGREAFLDRVTFSAERNLLIGKYLRASYERMGVAPSDFNAANAELFKASRAAVAAVEIELTGSPKIDASPEKAIAYLKEAESLAVPPTPASILTPAAAP